MGCKLTCSARVICFLKILCYKCYCSNNIHFSSLGYMNIMNVVVHSLLKGCLLVIRHKSNTHFSLRTVCNWWSRVYKSETLSIGSFQYYLLLYLFFFRFQELLATSLINQWTPTYVSLSVTEGVNNAISNKYGLPWNVFC